MEWQRRPPGGLLPGDPPRRDPRQGPRRPPGAGDARTRIAVGAGHGRRQARGLRIWIQDGEGASFWAHVCARSGQQGGARGVLIVCCDGPAGLPEAARGDLARLHGPHLRGPPRSAPPVRFVAYGDRKGVAAAGRPSLHRPRRGGRPTGPGRLPPVRPGPQVPPDGGDVGEGLGEEHRLPGLPPGPAPGHLCTTNAIESPSHRAARSAENRGHYLLRRGGGPNCCGRRVCNIEDRRAAERAKDEEHARPLAQGQRVDSSTGRVTTNRSAPPAHPARLAAAYPDRINPHL